MAYNDPHNLRKCSAAISIEQDLAGQTQLFNRQSNLGPSRLLRDVQTVMIPFSLRNNDSFLTQCCISNPTVESQQNNDTDSSSTLYMELRSAECEGLSLSFGRNKDRDKE